MKGNNYFVEIKSNDERSELIAEDYSQDGWKSEGIHIYIEKGFEKLETFENYEIYLEGEVKKIACLMNGNRRAWFTLDVNNS